MPQAPASLPSLLDDAPSEIDSPSEMLAADRTLTDLEPIPAEAPSSVELSATDLLEDDDALEDEHEDDLLATDESVAFRATEPALADATGEIDAADILEVASALRTSRLPALSVASAPPVASALPVPSAPLPTTRMPSSAAFPVATRMPSSAAMSAAHHPSSIAPLALEVRPSRPTYPSLPSWVPTPTSTQQIARMAGIPGRSPRFVMIAASVLGMCLFAAVGGAVLGYSRPHHDASESRTPVALHGAPRVAVVAGAREQVTEPPLTATAKDRSASGEAAPAEAAPPTAPVATVATVATVSTTEAPATRALEAPRAPARGGFSAPRASAPAAGSSSSSSSGVLRVSPSVSGVLVDGAPHKVSGGALTVSCGRHMVKAPGHAARLVIVPCGGHTSL